jgi:anti-sigma factor RsiW
MGEQAPAYARPEHDRWGLATARERLVERALQPPEIRALRNAAPCYIADPEGHRIEVWSEAHPDVATS